MLTQVLEAHSGHMERTIEYLLESQRAELHSPAIEQQVVVANGAASPASRAESDTLEADFAAALTVQMLRKHQRLDSSTRSENKIAHYFVFSAAGNRGSDVYGRAARAARRAAGNNAAARADPR